MTETSDIYLYNEMKGGNYIAFRTIYEKYAESLMNYASFRLENLDDGRDIVQDLFVVLWEKRNDIVIRESFKSYLFAALNKRLLNHYRKNNHRSKYVQYIAEMKQQYFHGPDKYFIAKEIQDELDNCINDLSPKVKEIYLLSENQFLSIAEIANMLSLSEQTVKNQLSTAKKIIRSKFKDHYIMISLYMLMHIY